VAFEPNPREHARLLRHLSWNAPHVQTCTLALSDQAGVLPLHLGPEGNSGMTTLTPWSEATSSGTLLVPVARGDDLIIKGYLPAPHLIKIDVEGHESAVLRGLSGTLKSGHCHTVIFEDGASDDTEAKQLLRSAGFSLVPLHRREQTGHSLENYLARKPSIA
jgi:FkbM family methyltransferase